uniref:Uncharacterized protein n=1 Tax=Tetradesmus obliquus TaxID=3088 RepID=A0A383V6B5_TETOB|eukprot:jgi/Sobl393_1/12909/SZX61147.1
MHQLSRGGDGAAHSFLQLLVVHCSWQPPAPEGDAVGGVGPLDAGTCRYQHPLVFPNQAGSTLFVYHSEAALELREAIVREGFRASKDPKKLASLVSTWSKVAALQLGVTLKYLSSAKDLGQFPVTVALKQ